MRDKNCPECQANGLCARHAPSSHSALDTTAKTNVDWRWHRLFLTMSIAYWWDESEAKWRTACVLRAKTQADGNRRGNNAKTNPKH